MGANHNEQRIATDHTDDRPARLQLRCTLAYGDIYGQILVWLVLSFLGLAAGMALMAAEHTIAGIAVIGLRFVLSLPFLMFSFVTTLFNHLILMEQR